MAAPQTSSATASMAGYLLQIYRAIYCLATAGAGDCVSIEALDDVVKIESDGTETWEQDKFTLSADGADLTDRSRELWRTIEIWAEAWATRDLQNKKVSFFLVTNRNIITEAMRIIQKF